MCSKSRIAFSISYEMPPKILIFLHKKPLKNRAFWRKKPLVLPAGTSVWPAGTKVWPAKQGIWRAKPFIPPAKQGIWRAKPFIPLARKAVGRARSRVRPAKQPICRANHSFVGAEDVGLNRMLSTFPESFTGSGGVAVHLSSAPNKYLKKNWRSGGALVGLTDGRVRPTEGA